MKRLIRQVNAKDLNTSLLNINEKLAALNVEYNYANLVANIREFEYYYNLLAEALGIDVKISVSVRLDHSNKIRIDLVKGGKELKLPDVNTVFHLATDMLINFDASVRGLYSSYNNEYVGHSADTSVETSYADDYISELKAEEAELETQVAKDGATQQEIADTIQQADTETQGRVDEAREEGSDVWDSTWETNKGSTTTSEEQERAMEAAREYAEDNARQNDLNNEAKAASEAADQANAAAQAANEAANEAIQSYTEAKDEYNDASRAYDEALAGHGAAIDVQTAANDGDLPPAGETTVIQGTADPDSVITITNNGDGTYTYTVENTNGTTDTRTSTLSDIVNGNDVNNAKSDLDNAQSDLQNAFDHVNTKESEMMDATTAAAAANAEAKAAQEAADQANQEAADASIPTATSDELDSGWYNSDAKDDDDSDDWGDFGDLIDGETE